ncbi:hypothetical protein N0V94_001590 [Neodidymelliopsis sp. IMI 364377]|nr:hypothetical protein N0V94_001590 [Neodidymelliopsis sp. IMI 364377]
MNLTTRTRAFRRNIMILHIVNLVLVLTALIAVFDSHKASSSFKSENIPRTPNAVSPSGYKYFLYDSGTFDLETWTCQLQSARGVGEAREDYRKQCDIEVAGRTMMVPFFVFAFIVAGTSIWSFVIGGKQSSRNEHLWTKDADPEFGKGDADGKQVQVEEVELATLERPDRQKNGRLSKIEEDEQEVEEAPKGATTVSTKVIDEDGEARTTEGSESVTKKTDAA